ncbi:MAG: helix-turn-helix domain-containing protein [Ferruginibacter sp.]
MNIQTFYPENPVLKKHIEYYYFLKTDSDNFTSTYYAFPNPLQSLNIHKYACCDINSHSTIVYGDKKCKYLLIVQGQHELPLFVQLKGILDKITILFKPLGLNHFIQKSLIEIAGEPSQVFTDWHEDKNFKKFLASFYGTDDHIKRIAVLENYLLSRYHSLGEEAILQQAINLLTDFDIEYSIAEIADKAGMNDRSFNRMLNKHLGISPVGFRKIARFRHSLENKLFEEKFKTLTEIGYESNYYDQSYFHKMYKKLTGQNPLKFFNSIEKLADDRLIFKFVNK